MRFPFINMAFAVAVSAICTLCLTGCSKKSGTNTNNNGSGGVVVTPPVTGPSDVAFYMTKGDGSALLQKQTLSLIFGTSVNNNPDITVDANQTYQSIDGFGYTFTGGTADLINGLPTANKDALLRELFSNDSTAIGVSYLRISIGASDLSASVFSYDDMPATQTDPTLTNFSLGVDTVNLIPLLKQILAINPTIKILGSPWSAPLWMKDNNSSVGGSLKPIYYDAYARYFVKYIKAMQAKGINIDAVTPQNEPLNPNNNPSMKMTDVEQATFIKNNLGPTFAANGISTKIIVWDHNCDVPSYPLTILNDPQANPYVDGSAFHLYAGDISAMTPVHNAFPNKNIYFTEQYTASSGTFAGDLAWHVRNLIIGAPRNWSRNVLEWNLASSAAYGPHTPGGCTTCKGALTIGAGTTRNVSYYIIAHASKFVKPGSTRVASNNVGSLYNVAYTTPDGKKVLIVVNDGSAYQTFNIKYNNKWVTAALDAGSVGTFVW